MSVPVADLLASFPAPGEDFVLRWDLFELPELYALLGTGEELVLKETEVLRDQLTVIGRAVLLQGERTAQLTLKFVADAANESVTGVTARVEAALALVDLATAWAVDLTEAPQAFLDELRELSAHYQLTVGSVVITAQTDRLRLVFATPTAGSGLTALVGIKGTDAYLSQLPYVGEDIPGGDEVGVRGAELVAVGPGGVSAAQGAKLNAAVADAVGEPNWPLMPDVDLSAGLWGGASFARPGQDPLVWLVSLRAPDLSWMPSFPSLSLGHLSLSGFGVSWSPGSGSGGSLGMSFDLAFDLRWLSLGMPDVGFDLVLPDVGELRIDARLPALSLSLPGGRELRFTVPDGPELPDWPGLPGLPGVGVLTGWWEGQPSLALPELAGLLGLTLPPLPDVFTPQLPSLGLRFDVRLGEFALTGVSSWLRGVFAALPAGPDWNLAWGKVALLGLGDLTAELGDLPIIGDLIPDLDFGLNGITLTSVGTDGLTLPQVGSLNGWLASLAGQLGFWWPKLPEGARPAGTDLNLDWRLPGLPSLDWGIPWPPPTGMPSISWKDLQLPDLGPLRLPRIGLTWPGSGEPGGGGGSGSWMRLVLDASFDLGGITIGLPDLGFDFDFSVRKVRPRFPSISLSLPSGESLLFAVPEIPGPPWPFAVTAVWEDEDGVSAADLAAGLDLDLSGVPPMLVPRLFKAAIHYDFRTGMLLVSAITQKLGWMLASEPVSETTRRYAVAVRGRVSAKASDLPLVGESITLDRDIALTGIAFAFASAPWAAGRVEAVNSIIDEIDTADPQQLPRLPGEALVRGALAWADLTADGQALPPLVVRLNDTGGLALPGAPDEAGPVDGMSGSAVVLGRERGGTRSGQARNDSAQEVDRVFGPVRIRRVSLGYAKGRLFVVFGATLTLGPVALDMIVLGLAVDQDFTVTPELAGAGVRIAVPPLKITGALEVRQDDAYEIYIAGLVAVEAGFFAMQAAGSYARSVDGWASVFLFGEAAAKGGVALFGPPAFTVTGLSGGFGVNSSVRVPKIEELPEFPLIARLDGRPEATPQEILSALTDWVRPADGQYWGAIGVQFTTFKFIDTKALALVEFGRELNVMLLGRTSITFPRNVTQGKKVHARLDLDLKLAYQQSQGLLSLDVAVGAGSFIFDPACRLTGGIAVYVWTAGTHAGDFVLSVGGYHPTFEKNLPVHYPRPARLGFTWSPDSKIMVKAEGYTALTPGAFMIGGRLAATYTAGLLSAWFTAHLDVLIQWKPFYLEMALGISIGVAFTIKVWFVRVRVSISVGIDLALWTPPFGGRVTVKVWFISFSFDIGSKRGELPIAEWPEVRAQLPAPLAITPTEGLLADVDAGELAARRAIGAPVLVSSDGFVFTTESALPATHVYLNDVLKGTADPAIAIRPMHRTQVTSEHRVTLWRNNGDEPFEPVNWTVTVLRKDVARALWGAPLNKPGDALNEDTLLRQRLSGLRFEVQGPEFDPDAKTGSITSQALGVEKVTPDSKLTGRPGQSAGPTPNPASGSIDTIAGAIADKQSRRDDAYAAMARLGVAPGANGSRAKYAAIAADTLVSSPLLTAAN